MTTLSNAFLIIRIAFFALLLMFALLLLAFTAWNLNSVSIIGQHAPASSIFITFTNCLLIVFIGSSTIEYFQPHIRSASVLVECGWAAIIALFQLGGAISTTTSGSSLICGSTRDWSVCASVSLLIHVSWLSALIAFAYFFTLFASVMSHVHTYPDIWTRTIYTVDWFVDPRVKAFLHQATSQPRLVSWSGYLEGIRSTAGRKRLYASEEERDIEKAPWAENINVCRGRDDPYASSTSCSSRSGHSTPVSFVPLSHNKVESISTRSELSLPCVYSRGRDTRPTENASLRSLPPLPPRSLSKGSSLGSFGSRFVERLSQDHKKSPQPVPPQIQTRCPFPSKMENHDLPIPLPHKSQWVYADKF